MKRLGLTILCAMALFAIAFTVYLQVSSSHHNNINRVEAAGESNVQDSATISFGAWMTLPVLDRFPNVSPPSANHHALTPKTVEIKAGGTVNFVISGLHQVLVYNNGTQPGDINTHLLIAPTGPGNLPPFLINDPNNRIYRGLDLSLHPRDRVEVVQFHDPGLYLVICAVLPHFQEGMFGFVRVLPNN